MEGMETTYNELEEVRELLSQSEISKLVNIDRNHGEQDLMNYESVSSKAFTLSTCTTAHRRTFKGYKSSAYQRSKHARVYHVPSVKKYIQSSFNRNCNKVPASEMDTRTIYGSEGKAAGAMGPTGMILHRKDEPNREPYEENLVSDSASPSSQIPSTEDQYVTTSLKGRTLITLVKSTNQFS